MNIQKKTHLSIQIQTQLINLSIHQLLTQTLKPNATHLLAYLNTMRRNMEEGNEGQ